MGIFDVVWLVRFQVALEVFCGLIFDATYAALEILAVFMCTHVPIDEKARREVFTTYLATERLSDKSYNNLR